MTDIRWNPTFGLEVEVFLIDEDGAPAHVVEDLEKRLGERFGNQRIAHEPSLVQIEYNTPVQDDIAELDEDLKEYFRVAREEAGALNADILPVGSFMAPGADLGWYPDERYEAYRRVAGEERFSIWRRNNGTHVHVLKHEDPQTAMNQANLAIMAEPAVMAMSTSPVLEGMNGLANHRIDDLAGDYIPGVSAHEGHRSSYITDWERYWEENQKHVDAYNKVYAEAGESTRGRLDRVAGRTLVRLGDRSRPPTIEARSADAAPREYLVAAAALYTGLARTLPGREVSLGTYEPGKLEDGRTLNLPSEEELEDMERRWVSVGTSNDPHLRDYAFEVVRLAEQGLRSHETYALDPLKRSIGVAAPMEPVLHYARSHGIPLHDRSMTPEQGFALQKFTAGYLNDGDGVISRSA